MIYLTGWFLRMKKNRTQKGCQVHKRRIECIEDKNFNVVFVFKGVKNVPLNKYVPPDTIPVDNLDQISVGLYLAISSRNTSNNPKRDVV